MTTATGELHLSRVGARVFAERPGHVVPPAHARILNDLARGEFARNGNSFRGMTAALVADLAEPLDLVVLAYAEPDLHVPEVAGCYLAHACPGDPVSYSVSEQGTGATFTALRMADAMCRLGELTAGAVFALDRALLLDTPNLDDCAVLLQVGTTGGLCVESITETVVAGPAAVLAAAPGTRFLVGAGLSDALAGSPLLRAPRVHLPRPRLGVTSAWATLADRWPITEPVVVADFDPDTRRLYTCALRPGGAR
ncbi:hypothetical protein [Actinokineospora sp.]|uniref:hypothetical protein n=1 Tax=Actinokineospora sp. TaxID=1872133 RepID=UPI004037A59D